MAQSIKRVAVHAQNRPDCQFWIASTDRWQPVESVGGVLQHVAENVALDVAVAFPATMNLDDDRVVCLSDS